MSNITIGTYSGGCSFIGQVSQDLCVPLGLGLPEPREYVIDESPFVSVDSVPTVDDKKIDGLFQRVVYSAPGSKRRTRKVQLKK